MIKVSPQHTNIRLPFASKLLNPSKTACPSPAPDSLSTKLILDKKCSSIFLLNNSSEDLSLGIGIIIDSKYLLTSSKR